MITVGRISDTAASLSLATINWPAFPAHSDASFRIAWDGERILLRFDVHDTMVQALETTDNGPVWRDRCVEWFLSLDGIRYYNMEWNAAGTMLCQYGTSRHDREFMAPERLTAVERISSLGKAPIALIAGPVDWSLTLRIPAAFFGENARHIVPGATVRGNFYLCGDDLPEKQYLSHYPVASDRPDFHRPETFGPISFR
ncbi:MAG TPA: carbohydrate-binding family 9-like protein [bacterium]|nr:carbohydrate-binding family 9-like protein [bacterium]